MKKSLKSILALCLCLMMAAGIIPLGITEANATSNEQKIYDFLINTMKYNKAAAVGVLANIYFESSFDPTNNYTEEDGSIAYGICQWRLERLDGLKSFSKKNGLDYTKLDAQLQYLKEELTGSSSYALHYSAVNNYMKKVANAQDGAYNAGYYWCYYYEVPKNRDTVAIYRGNIAKNTYWPKYGGEVIHTLKISYNTNGSSLDSSDYYLDGYKIFKSSDKTRYYQSWKYNETKDNGLTNKGTFGMYRDGYTYLGWGLTKTYYADTGKYFNEKDSSLVPSDFSDTIKNQDETIGMFAQWTENVLTVNYYSNYATATSTGKGIGENSCYYTDDFKYSNAYDKGLTNYTSGENNAYASRTGYTATGNWNTMPDGSGLSISQKQGFASGQELAEYLKLDLTKKSASINLYPEWVKNTEIYTVTLDANGGSVTTSQITVTDGETYGTLPEATMSGYSFAGWYTAAEGGTQVTGSTKVTGSITLYAHWISNIHIHSFTSAVTPATCTAQGYTTYTCSCGYSYTDNVTEKTAHNYIISASSPATCTENGTKTYKCSSCGNINTVTDYAKGHITIVKRSNYTEATCDTDGGYIATTVCGKCGITVDEEYIVIEATGHSFSDYVYNNTNHTKTMTCTKCGLAITEPIPYETKISISNYSSYNGKTVDYKSTITFHASVENDEGNTIHWYVNGSEYGTGSSCTVSKVTSDFSIYCTTENSYGNTITSETETVKVNSDFFAKVIAFFRGLFGTLPTLDQ